MSRLSEAVRIWNKFASLRLPWDSSLKRICKGSDARHEVGSRMWVDRLAYLVLDLQRDSQVLELSVQIRSSTPTGVAFARGMTSKIRRKSKSSWNGWCKDMSNRINQNHHQATPARHLNRSLSVRVSAQHATHTILGFAGGGVGTGLVSHEASFLDSPVYNMSLQEREWRLDEVF